LLLRQRNIARRAHDVYAKAETTGCGLLHPEP
jgi:hypothetical protein